MKPLFFILLLIGCCPSLWGQSYSFRHYQVEDNLSYNSVTCSLQDKNGFLWFGTKDGLNRFDGYTFKVFRKTEDTANCLGNNTIFSLSQGLDNTIWVGTQQGLYQYNILTERFSLVNGTKNNFIRTIVPDTQGNIWFVKDYSLACYNQKNRKMLVLPKAPEDIHATSVVINNHTVWLSTTDGFLWEYNTLSNLYQKHDIFKNSQPAISHWIDKIFDTGQNALLVGTSSQGVKLFNTTTKTYQDILTLNQHKTALYVRDFMHRSGDEYWIATESGVYIYYLQSKRYIQLTHEYNNPYALSDNAVYSLCKDREGGIWIGTYFGGINYLPTQHTTFDKYFNQGTQNSITGNAVREICQDHFGNLWIGTEDNGLNKLHLQTKKLTHFKPDGSGHGISHSNIHGLLVVGDQLWVGTFEQGLAIMDIKTGKVIKHFVAGNGPNALKSNFIEGLFKTHDNAILVATSNGLFRFNPKEENFSPLPYVQGHFIALIEDSDGTLWAATSRNGLFHIDLKTHKTEHYTNQDTDLSSLSSNSVNGMFVDSQHTLWVTTENGLNKFDRKLRHFTRYSTKNGFPSNVFYKILEDNKQNLWISTSKGLVSLNLQSHKIFTFTKANGILSDQFNYNSAYKDQEGRMYFGSVKGLISFMPDTFTQNTTAPAIYLTGFQVDNKELPIQQEDSPLEKTITFTKEITLAYNQSTFSIDFAALGYTAPEMTEYMYILEGLDKQWTYLKTNRKVYFTKLSAGHYTFKVRASNSSGLWSHQMAVLTIEIQPPFWASIPAYILYSIVAIVLLILSVRQYHNKIAQDNQRKIALLEVEKEKEIYQAKMEFFTHVTHEIRTPLTLIKAPLEDLLKKVQENSGIKANLLTMERNTNRLLDLTNQLLDFRKTEAKGFSLSLVKVNISQFLQDRFDEFYPMAAFKQMQFEIELPAAVQWAFVDKEAFYKIITNLLDNAIKYAESKAIVRLKSSDESPEHFVIEVLSNGNLIPKDFRQRIFEPFFRMHHVSNEQGTGIGLSLARSLAELHGGTLQVGIQQNMNVFWVSLPIHHANELGIEKEKHHSSGTKAHTSEPIDERSTILVVEDNHEIAHFITEKLQAEYHIVQANNGKKALEVLQNQSVHLILSDVMMPIMDGFEFCKIVKSNLNYSHIPLILLTAKNTLQSKIVGLELGADAYIEKPFSLDHLLTQIANLLINRDKIKNYFANSPLVHIKSMAYNKSDELFLEKINEAIFQNIDNPLLDVDLLADMMNMSRPTLYRKVKAIANLSPNELIVITRLKKAAELLVQSDFKIQKIASMTGFSSQAQFGRCFLKQFGMRPSEFAKSKQNNAPL